MPSRGSHSVNHKITKSLFSRPSLWTLRVQHISLINTRAGGLPCKSSSPKYLNIHKWYEKFTRGSTWWKMATDGVSHLVTKFSFAF